MGAGKGKNKRVQSLKTRSDGLGYPRFDFAEMVSADARFTRRIDTLNGEVTKIWRNLDSLDYVYSVTDGDRVEQVKEKHLKPTYVGAKPMHEHDYRSLFHEQVIFNYDPEVWKEYDGDYTMESFDGKAAVVAGIEFKKTGGGRDGIVLTLGFEVDYGIEVLKGVAFYLDDVTRTIPQGPEIDTKQIDEPIF